MHVLKSLTNRSERRDHVAFRMDTDGLIMVVGVRRERHIYTVDINNLTIMKHIPENLDIKVNALDDFEIIRLIYQAYLYTLRLSNTKTMRRMSNLPKDLITGLKDNLFMSRDILRYKIATMRCVSEGLEPRQVKQIERHFKACGLNADDTIFYHMLYHNNQIHEFSQLMDQSEDNRFVLMVDTIPYELDHNDKARKVWMKQSSYYAYRKLAFIAFGNRFTPEDLQQDLLQRATQAYYWVRPFYSIEHAINYGKAAMHGHMNCLIDFYNDESRRRITEDTGFGSTNVTCDYDDGLSFADNARNFYEEAIVEMIDMKREYQRNKFE